MNLHGYESGFTIEQHIDKLIARLGSAIKTINEAQAQLAAKDAVIEGLKRALKRLERVITELYPGDGKPDEEHIEEYRAVWSAIGEKEERYEPK